MLSSQASSAGRDEELVRRRIVETGDVDAMIAVRGNFFCRNDALGSCLKNIGDACHRIAVWRAYTSGQLPEARYRI